MSAEHRTPPSDLPIEAFDSLLTAARAGSEWAWARLVHDIDPVLRGYLRRQGGGDLDDLAGETWLHVARNASTFQGNYESFRSWVFMIAHHRIIDERRRRRRRPQDLDDGPGLELISAPMASAETDAMESLEESDLLSMLDVLTDEQREVVLLRLMAGFGITEIAQIIGKKPGAVQALQHRAFRRLQKNFEKAVRE